MPGTDHQCHGPWLPLSCPLAAADPLAADQAAAEYVVSPCQAVVGLAVTAVKDGQKVVRRGYKAVGLVKEVVKQL